MTYDIWKTENLNDVDLVSTYPDLGEPEPLYAPGDRVHHRCLGLDATVIGDSRRGAAHHDRVLVQYDDDGTLYSLNPWFLDPIES